MNGWIDSYGRGGNLPLTIFSMRPSRPKLVAHRPDLAVAEMHFDEFGAASRCAHIVL
jgi:hypothetical protein